MCIHKLNMNVIYIYIQIKFAIRYNIILKWEPLLETRKPTYEPRFRSGDARLAF